MRHMGSVLSNTVLAVASVNSSALSCKRRRLKCCQMSEDAVMYIQTNEQTEQECSLGYLRP